MKKTKAQSGYLVSCGYDSNEGQYLSGEEFGKIKKEKWGYWVDFPVQVQDMLREETMRSVSWIKRLKYLFNFK